jgi:hypothetical protein
LRVVQSWRPLKSLAFSTKAALSWGAPALA